MDRLVLGACIGFAAAYFYFNADHRQQTLSAFVSDLPRGSLDIPMYWLEMRNVVNEWEEMILVSGYADNRTVCDVLNEFAKQDSPNRQFRCSPAN